MEKPRYTATGLICPCCKQPFPKTEVPIVDLNSNKATYEGLTWHLTPKMAEMLHILTENYPKFVEINDLNIGLYGHASDISKGRGSIAVYAMHLRDSLNPVGWNIICTSKGCSLVKITPTRRLYGRGRKPKAK